MRKRPTEERFWEKVEKTPTCWIWTAGASAGYGRIHDGGRWRAAHRVSYELHRGIIPEGMTLDHLCRNKLCVNPDHLEMVTSAENTRRHYRLKTHCKRGHVLASANFKGIRQCCECNRFHAAANRAFKRLFSNSAAIAAIKEA